MSNQLVNDRGEIVGARLTVYHLLVDFADPTKTESLLCKLYGLSAEQVAAARAFVLRHPDTVLAQHLEIEKRIAAGNPPAVIEQAKRAHESLSNFKQWLDERDKAHATEKAASPPSGRNGSFPTFRDWVAQEESRQTERS